MESQTKKKILFIITQGEWGGAQRYVFDLSDNAPDNFEIFVAVGEKDGKKDLQEKFKNNPRVKIIQLKHLKRKISPANDVLAIFELKKIFNKINPDIIHLNSSKAGILGSLTKLMGYNKNNSARIIYTVHGWVFNEPNRKLGRIIYRWLEKITSTYKDKIIVLSEKEKNDAINLKIGKNKLIKIPLGIKIPKFLEKNKAREIINKLSDAKTVKHLSNQDIWFGTVANFYKSKGLDILIESINILNLKQSRKNYQFFIIGDGPEKKNVKELIKKYNLEEYVSLIGSLKDASRYLQAFDVFVLSSRKEGLPYTILEAITAKIPIIATDVGGIPEIIENEKTGFVSPASPELISNNLSKFIYNKNLLNKIDEKNDFTLEKMLNSTYELYY